MNVSSGKLGTESDRPAAERRNACDPRSRIERSRIPRQRLAARPQGRHRQARGATWRSWIHWRLWRLAPFALADSEIVRIRETTESLRLGFPRKHETSSQDTAAPECYPMQSHFQLPASKQSQHVFKSTRASCIWTCRRTWWWIL